MHAALRALRASAQPLARTLSSTAAKAAPFYELRTYSINPKDYSAFLKLTEQKIALRTAHSKLLGYWTVEFGGINQVVHIWEYDSYAQRTGVRAALGKDTEWVSTYMSVMLPMLQKQDNLTMIPVLPSTAPPSIVKGGVYELQVENFAPEAIKGRIEFLSQASDILQKYTNVVGTWSTTTGVTDNIVRLMHFKSLDHRAEMMDLAEKEIHLSSLDPLSCPILQSMQSKILIPTSFSPLN